MGTFSIWHWLIVLVVVLVLFGGKGKVSALMGDFGKGLKSFKKGMKEDGIEASVATDTAATGTGDEEAKMFKSEDADVSETTELDKDKAAQG
jgi:sec-independent protein translocase protein TatA